MLSPTTISHNTNSTATISDKITGSIDTSHLYRVSPHSRPLGSLRLSADVGGHPACYFVYCNSGTVFSDKLHGTHAGAAINRSWCLTEVGDSTHRHFEARVLLFFVKAS